MTGLEPVFTIFGAVAATGIAQQDRVIYLVRRHCLPKREKL
jgi:hypothetical protein